MALWKFWQFQQDISKIICARSLKLIQLIGNDEKIIWLNFEEILSNISGVMALCKKSAFQTCQQDFSKSIWTWSADRGWWVDYLINFWTNSIDFFLELYPFENFDILN